MTATTGRFAGAIGIAGLAGALHGLGLTVPLLVHASTPGLSRSPGELDVAASAVILLSLAVSIGVFLAGYRWADRATIPGAYGRFAVSLLGAAIVGAGGVALAAVVLPDPELVPYASRPAWNAGRGVAGGVVEVAFVGLAGGAVAQYRSVTDASRRQWRIKGYTSRVVVAIGLAGAAGVLHGLGSSLPLLAGSSTAGLGSAGASSAESIELFRRVAPPLSFAVALGLFVAGYWWTGRADVPVAYGRFALTLFVAALVGHGVGLLPGILLLAAGEEPVVAATLAVVAIAASSILVPAPGLAGGTIAQYRSHRDTY